MKAISFSLIIGIAISLGLFWFMQMMISNNQIGFKKSEPLHMTEFVRLKRDSKLQTKERRVIEEEPPPPEKRPPPPMMQTQQVQATQTNAPKMDMPSLDIPLQASSFNHSALAGVSMAAATEKSAVPTGVGVSTGISMNLIPLSKINPRYPSRAVSRRIEGWVKIELTITKEGIVSNAKVIEYKPSKIFNHSALRAIKRWKFKPKIINGVAVEQHAIQKLTFTLKK